MDCNVTSIRHPQLTRLRRHISMSPFFTTLISFYLVEDICLQALRPSSCKLFMASAQTSAYFINQRDYESGDSKSS